MKKVIAVCILYAVCIGVLAGCAQEDPECSIESYDEESRISASRVQEETDLQSEDSSDSSDATTVTDPKTSTESSHEQSEESICETSPDEETSNKYNVLFTEEMVRELKIEIYEEKSQELLETMVVTDQEICAKVFAAFDACFEELCEKYPHDAAPDMATGTDYRVAVYLNTYQDSTKEKLAHYIGISYPYGYTNDIYRLMHHGGSPFGEYVARLGKPFIDMVDEYVKEYFANK